jgi:hypothetical protein
VNLISHGMLVPADRQFNSGNVSITDTAVNYRNPNSSSCWSHNEVTVFSNFYMLHGNNLISFVRFLVINDGSPFSVVLKYGSNGQHLAYFTVNGAVSLTNCKRQTKG